jgi:hypothetical protein
VDSRSIFECIAFNFGEKFCRWDRSLHHFDVGYMEHLAASRSVNK